jgi:arabinogalactan endo-1,4-beta-galactosidase
MVYYNYLRDYSFEEGGSAWTVTDLGHANELYVEEKKTDSLTGTKHMHFWSAARDSVEFTVEQAVEEVELSLDGALPGEGGDIAVSAAEETEPGKE